MSDNFSPQAAKRWCFTFNNYNDVEEMSMLEFLREERWVNVIVGREVAPTTNMRHLQGYFDGPQIKFTTLKLKFPKCSFRAAKGSPESNRVYCSKEGNVILQKGDFAALQPGKRSDIDAIRELVSGPVRVSRREIYNNAASFQAFRFGEIGLTLRVQPAIRKRPKVYWIWGPTGTGKSHWAATRAPEAYWTNPPATHGGTWWFCGYDGHEDVIIDDFRAEWCAFSTLLKLLDKYPMGVQPKGCPAVPWVPKRIFITCPTAPDNTYGFGENKEQLVRRIRKIIHLEERFVEPVSESEDDSDADLNAREVLEID